MLIEVVIRESPGGATEHMTIDQQAVGCSLGKLFLLHDIWFVISSCYFLVQTKAIPFVLNTVNDIATLWCEWKTMMSRHCVITPRAEFNDMDITLSNPVYPVM